MIREFDQCDGWSGGFRTCAHWLSWRTGISRGAAREKVRVASAIESLPATSEAMRTGRLSYSKARAVTRVATPANEDELLDFAYHATASQVERFVGLWRRLDRVEDAEETRRRHENRELRLIPVNGMVEIRGRLDPEAGAVLMKALSIAEDALFRESAEAADSERRPSAQQRSADALVRLAEVALEGDLSGETQGSASERFQVVVHVTAGAVVATEATLEAQPSTAPPTQRMALSFGEIENGLSGRASLASRRLARRRPVGPEVAGPTTDGRWRRCGERDSGLIGAAPTRLSAASEPLRAVRHEVQVEPAAGVPWHEVHAAQQGPGGVGAPSECRLVALACVFERDREAVRRTRCWPHRQIHLGRPLRIGGLCDEPLVRLLRAVAEDGDGVDFERALCHHRSPGNRGRGALRRRHLSGCAPSPAEKP